MQNRVVTVSDLIVAVDIALGHAPLSRCRAADLTGAGRVTISDLIQAVDAALMGCPS